MPGELIPTAWACSTCGFCTGEKLQVWFWQLLRGQCELLTIPAAWDWDFLAIYTPRNLWGGEELVPSRNNLEGFAPKIFGMESRAGRWQVGAKEWEHQSISATQIWFSRPQLGVSKAVQLLNHDCGATKIKQSHRGKGNYPRLVLLSQDLCARGEWKWVKELFSGKSTSHPSQTMTSLRFCHLSRCLASCLK